MLTNGQYIKRHFIGFFSGIGAMAAVGFLFPVGYFAAFAFPVTYYVLNKGILFAQQTTRAKQLAFSRKEFLYIEGQLNEATQKANALTQKYVQVRSVKSFRSIYDMSKLAKRIITLVKKDPTKYYLIEDFFYAHLPSALELSDKYALLTKEQVGGTEIHLALNEARNTLKQLHQTMEDDLKRALATDIESLKIEMDFAKIANEQNRLTHEQPLQLEEEIKNETK